MPVSVIADIQGDECTLTPYQRALSHREGACRGPLHQDEYPLNASSYGQVVMTGKKHPCFKFSSPQYAG